MRWSHEYLNVLNQFTKWHSTNKDYKIGDIVCLRDGPTAPTRWPLARITNVYLGEDGKVHVVTVKTAKGIYKRPIEKALSSRRNLEGKNCWVLASGMMMSVYEDVQLNCLNSIQECDCCPMDKNFDYLKSLEVVLCILDLY